jgi:hypothetical protein
VTSPFYIVRGIGKAQVVFNFCLLLLDLSLDFRVKLSSLIYASVS